jgi:hypothetical protein
MIRKRVGFRNSSSLIQTRRPPTPAGSHSQRYRTSLAPLTARIPAAGPHLEQSRRRRLRAFLPSLSSFPLQLETGLLALASEER